MDGWRIVHVLGLIWLGAGLGSTYPLVLRAWVLNDLRSRATLLAEAADNEIRVLVPGAMVTGVTGFFWAVSGDYNFLRDGWLAALAGLYVFFYLVCLPLFGVGLRRARDVSLAAAGQDEETEEMREILADRVPLVFGALLVLGVPVLAWLAVFKPF